MAAWGEANDFWGPQDSHDAQKQQQENQESATAAGLTSKAAAPPPLAAATPVAVPVETKNKDSKENTRPGSYATWTPPARASGPVKKVLEPVEIADKSKLPSNTSTHQVITVTSPRSPKHEIVKDHHEPGDAAVEVSRPSLLASTENRADPPAATAVTAAPTPAQSHVHKRRDHGSSSTNNTTNNEPLDTSKANVKEVAQPVDMRARIVKNLEKQKRNRAAAAAARHLEEEAALDRAREKQRQKEEQDRQAQEEGDSSSEAAQRHDDGVQQKQLVLPSADGMSLRDSTPAQKQHGQHGVSRWTTASQAATTGLDDHHSQDGDQVDDDLVASQDSARAASEVSFEPDIRGGDLTMPSVRIDWDACRQRGWGDWAQRSAGSGAEFPVDSELERYVKFWLKSARDFRHHAIKIKRHKDHEHCDVDTMTGDLLGPIAFPHIETHPEDKKKTMNHRFFAGISMPGANSGDAKRGHDQGAGQEIVPDSTTSSTSDRLQSEGTAMSTDVKIPSHLRPATEADMKAVAEIYNLEVRDSHRTLDTNPVAETDFDQLFTRLKAIDAPFLVAVKGWHKSLLPSSPSAARKRRNATTTNNKNNIIIGFALVDVLSPGIAGSPLTCAAPCGRITLIVHPDHRGKRIGTAMMDVILSVCSQRHHSLGGYQFVNPSDDRRFVEPMDNLRRWYTLFLDLLVESSPESATLYQRFAASADAAAPPRTAEHRAQRLRQHREWWVAEWLESRFGTLLVEHTERLYKHDSADAKGRGWLDRLVMKHECRSK
ncbi:uncharacterized protein B0I36DRAFT_428425 [Microdochium trichocladiopsis]|uniref:N-acetyltransferase domain-containing protein n=1 Tax=Microdochium trichocladiopsis TaxID=1682393 RepID=A0A9P8YF72_9PEZI|nr:uncharacterized protein B0I36DRAFT_428425 [Microdochium trichocladiopsis]KAH7037881.1 hypothetical protein B0I36DRAFT_428425 [Microdochium trichocladiopsis]